MTHQFAYLPLPLQEIPDHDNGTLITKEKIFIHKYLN